MYATPTATTAMPTGVNSKSLRGERLYLGNIPLTAMLVEVPRSVQVPPSIDAKANGMSNFDGLTCALRAIPRTMGKKTAVVAVLLMKAETVAMGIRMISARARGFA